MSEGEAGSADGRRRRSEQSRGRIVDAMLALVAEGQITPGAEQVATRASVGLRSVFRHFRDMESLYAEMTARLSRQYEGWLAPFAAADWHGQLTEALERRVATYEKLMPFKRAADAHRHESPVIKAEHVRMLQMMRARLKSLLPETLANDDRSFEALDLLLSFETWQRLRMEQQLPPERALTIVRGLMDNITGVAPGAVRPAAK